MASPAARARPKLYVEIGGVKAAAKCGLRKKALETLTKEFSASNKVTLDIGKPAPKGKALAKVLKKRRLKGYRVQLRITKCGTEVHPPPKGKVYRVLMASVSVAVDAEKLPSDQMALAGQGSASVGTEISTVKEKEKRQLLGEAMVAATKQAVGKSIATLLGGKTKKRRRRRRKRRRK
ncbi:MAG: hypothetical protein KC503_38270 [Myxococcales bacterium]|nr:hypothetical protein [Myxococcales bacterium]